MHGTQKRLSEKLSRQPHLVKNGQYPVSKKMRHTKKIRQKNLVDPEKDVIFASVNK
jgi:hypothetical protein